MSKDYMPNAYYDALAENYDASYADLDQALKEDLRLIRDEIQQFLVSAEVLELASGSGFWSREIARVAKRVVAIERSEVMLAEAKAAKVPENLHYQKGDVWDLQELEGEFSGLVANFWFSHVPKARIPEFLGMVAKRLVPGAVVIMADSLSEVYKPKLLPIEGSAGDTYVKRDMGEAGQFEVLKNCYSGEEIYELLEGSEFCNDVKVQEGNGFWIASYLTPDAEEEGYDDGEYDLSDVLQA